MIRPIVRYGADVLHQPAAPVEAVTPEIQALIDDMIQTMYAAPGVGLAAPQVGVGVRIFVCDISVGRNAGGPADVHQPDVCRARRHAARRRRLPQRTWFQRDGRAALTRDPEGAGSQR